MQQYIEVITDEVGPYEWNFGDWGRLSVKTYPLSCLSYSVLPDKKLQLKSRKKILKGQQDFLWTS